MFVYAYAPTIWKFERKNSQEYHHMVWNGATNRLVEKRSTFAHIRAEISNVQKNAFLAKSSRSQWVKPASVCRLKRIQYNGLKYLGTVNRSMPSQYSAPIFRYFCNFIKNWVAYGNNAITIIVNKHSPVYPRVENTGLVEEKENKRTECDQFSFRWFYFI